MRILFLDAVPDQTADNLYIETPTLAEEPFATQLEHVNELGLGRADFLARAVSALGVEAAQVITNVFPLQSRWAHERGLRISFHNNRGTYREWRRFPERFLFRLLRRMNAEPVEEDWHTQVVAAQVEVYDPDVIVDGDLQFPVSFLERIKGKRRFLVGLCPSPVPVDRDLRAYDLILGGRRDLVERFRASGATAELFRPAFEPSILEKLEGLRRTQQTVFVGSVGRNHRRRLAWLETLAQSTTVRAWCRGVETIADASPLRPRVQGPVWGYEMYHQLARSGLTIHVHRDGEGSAGSARLFEATGAGTLVITDDAPGIGDIFEPDKEVVVARSAAELIEKVAYYVDNPKEGKPIAKAGQDRTLHDHTYRHRAAQLMGILGARVEKRQVG